LLIDEIRFLNPPLTEVVCGVVFDAPEFSSVHFGVYWDRIRQRFPERPMDQPPLTAVDVFGLSLLPPLRRVWFESEDKKELVQLQADRFYYNWRKQSEGNDYPRFKYIYPKFKKEWDNFHQWCTEEVGLLVPAQYELTYSNQIDKKFGWTGAVDNQKIFTFEGRDWNGFLSPPESHVFTLQFALPDGSGTLTVNGRQVVQGIEQEAVMLLELTARSSEDEIDLDEWFGLAHNYILHGFLDLTKTSLHEKGGLT
jgi:uncharacterized protein (TIGR04255 family)